MVEKADHDAVTATATSSTLSVRFLVRRSYESRPRKVPVELERVHHVQFLRSMVLEEAGFGAEVESLATTFLATSIAIAIAPTLTSIACVTTPSSATASRTHGLARPLAVDRH